MRFATELTIYILMLKCRCRSRFASPILEKNWKERDSPSRVSIKIIYEVKINDNLITNGPVVWCGNVANFE